MGSSSPWPFWRPLLPGVASGNGAITRSAPGGGSGVCRLTRVDFRRVSQPTFAGDFYVTEHLDFHGVGSMHSPFDSLSQTRRKSSRPDGLSPGRTTVRGRRVPGGIASALLVSAGFISLFRLNCFWRLVAQELCHSRCQSLPGFRGLGGQPPAIKPGSESDCLIAGLFVLLLPVSALSRALG